MLGMCKKELEFYVTHIEDMVLSDTKTRLENFLVKHATQKRSSKIELPVPRCELAILLGTTPENLSRIIKHMTASGQISIKGREVSLNF